MKTSCSACWNSSLVLRFGDGRVRQLNLRLSTLNQKFVNPAMHACNNVPFIRLERATVHSHSFAQTHAAGGWTWTTCVSARMGSKQQQGKSYLYYQRTRSPRKSRRAEYSLVIRISHRARHPALLTFDVIIYLSIHAAGSFSRLQNHMWCNRCFIFNLHHFTQNELLYFKLILIKKKN